MLQAAQTPATLPHSRSLASGGMPSCKVCGVTELSRCTVCGVRSECRCPQVERDYCYNCRYNQMLPYDGCTHQQSPPCKGAENPRKRLVVAWWRGGGGGGEIVVVSKGTSVPRACFKLVCSMHRTQLTATHEQRRRTLIQQSIIWASHPTSTLVCLATTPFRMIDAYGGMPPTRLSARQHKLTRVVSARGLGRGEVDRECER